MNHFPDTIEDRERSPLPPIAGKIKIGTKVKVQGKKGEVEVPKKLDHFRFVPNDGPDAPRLLAAWDALYAQPQKGRPTQVPVMLPGTDRRRYFPQAYRAFKKGRMWCTGNNRVARRRNSDWSGWERVECNASCRFRKLPDVDDRTRICEEGGILHLILPELPIMGVFVVEASTMSMDSIDGHLDIIQGAADRVGIPISQLPLHLQLKAVPNTRYGTVYVFELVLRIGVQQLVAARQDPLLLLGASPTASADVEQQDAADVGAEQTQPESTEGAHRAVEPAAEPVVDEGLQAEADDLRRQCYGLIGRIDRSQKHAYGTRLKDAGDDVRALTELRDELRRVAPPTSHGDTE